MRKFLLHDESQSSEISYEQDEQNSVKMDNCSFGWSKSEEILREVSLEVRQKGLVAFVGKVGSGKSSLLSAMLGEMHKLNDGRINVNGTTAYVPQQAWIQNATVRDNILFGREYDEKLYNQVISACCLLPDLEIMAAGDKTEIGEKGINLSGGQKQRISLARALYSDAEIYMLDDPLSAVDSHVGKSIFDSVIGPNGMLKDKTRLFVTNSLSFLPQCDQIIMLDNGTISEVGQYDDLKERDGAFANFIKLFLANNETSKENIKTSSF
jgi:ABC-type multidrug transport system fused ATPase/permease subunit